MKQTTKEKLIRSSNAITHYLFKEDNLGMAELTTPGIIISFTVFLGVFVGSALLLGGF